MEVVRYLPIDDVIVKELGKMESFNFTNVYNFEKVSTGLEAAYLNWMQKRWHWSVYMSAAYVVLVFTGRSYMKSRPAFGLRPLLAVWSAILAVFSIMGAYRVVPDLVHTIRNYSGHHSVCHPHYFYGVTGFWSICFVFSKAYELGDTAFIVLRKQHLAFLHWYHHVTVFVYVWFSYSEHAAAGRWFFAMNYTVHAFMYSYYSLRALQFRLPRWISISITSMQIVQMIGGCLVLAYVLWTKLAGMACHVSDANLISGGLMYLSYLVLFSQFFYNAYLRPKPHSATAAGNANKSVVNSNGDATSTTASASGSSQVASVIKSVADIERRGYVMKKDN